MADRPPRNVAEALELAFKRIRALEAAKSQPRTRLLVENWSITEDDDGNLVMKSKNGTATHVFDKD